MRYAVYIIVVEDTEENDLTVMTQLPMESGERVAGDLPLDEAIEVTLSVVTDFGNSLAAK